MKAVVIFISNREEFFCAAILRNLCVERLRKIVYDISIKTVSKIISINVLMKQKHVVFNSASVILKKRKGKLISKKLHNRGACHIVLHGSKKISKEDISQYKEACSIFCVCQYNYKSFTTCSL